MKTAFTFVSELVVFSVTLIALIILIAVLHGVLVVRLGWPDDAWVTPAYAGTPDAAVATIYAVGGPVAPCLERIFWREDPGGQLHQQNLAGSAAHGWLQMMPSTFASTPQGYVTDIWHATGEQQIAAGRWLLENGWRSAWSPLPAGC
jgi:hypothetical protein